ncbi:hypothetical protein NKH94_15515 [Mesorhizobium australicum]|uniref:hypothetical protein n=1 Tax=Mesorhizobium australicum TaxID=536018 RepID=UPI0033396E54
MSIWDIHYAALYASPIAVDAVLVVACGDPPRALRAIDKTAPKTIGFQGVDVLTIGPAAAVRAIDLVDVDPADLANAELTINGKCWRVVSHQPQPAPTGESAGEVLLILSER